MGTGPPSAQPEAEASVARLELRGLMRRYPGAETAALAALDLQADDGELVVLVGPSGCGKSTVLRLVAGLDTPDGGKVLLDGRDMTQVPPQERDMAMVFQGYALYPHLSARDNIAFPLKMRGVPAAERRRRVDEAAAMLGLARLLDRRPDELSGGERQRVAMGRAIVRAPRVFLFDEPLSNLDAARRAELRVEIAALVRRLGVTSLYVTHDQIEAMTMGDRIVVMHKGELQQVGRPRAIYEDPANTFVAGFLGSPPINWIDLARHAGRFEGAGAVWPAPRAPGERAELRAGVRPEQVRTSGDGVAIDATVILNEPLGAETHVRLDAMGTRLCARAPGFDAPERGARVRTFVAEQAVLWFDAATGERLRPEA
jgi:multiple sugar transport system ATP-binding protein